MACLREIARLADQIGDSFRLGRALLNLSAFLAVTDRAAAVDAGRTAATHLRRTGAPDYLATAVLNLADALIQLGHSDTAGTELAQALDHDGLADIEYLVCIGAWLSALRATRRPPKRPSRACRTCAPAKPRRPIRRSASPRPSPPSPTVSQRRR